MAMHSAEIFQEMLPNLYRRGVYVREDALMDAIGQCDCKEKNRQRMADYVRLAKKYSSEQSPAFVNGVLASFVPEQTEES